MENIIKQTIHSKPIQLILLGAIVAALLVVLMPEVGFTQASEVRQGIGATGVDTTEGEARSGINSLIQTTINIISWIVGIISVIMIIIGGLKYIMSTGDSQKVDSAKNTILYAVIGLVIVAFAQIIVLFVLDTTTGN